MLSAEARIRLAEIISLKQQFWPYSQYSQQEWFDRNVSPSDWHVLAYDESNKLVGYVRIATKGTSPKMTAIIDTLCTDRKAQGRGIARSIMAVANDIIRRHEYRAFLTCRSDLVAFYQKCGWRRNEVDIPSSPLLSKNETIMTLADQHLIDSEKHYSSPLRYQPSLHHRSRR
jgi:predicted GNAT family N-acyltransferase